MKDIKTGARKMANWKAAGADLVQGYWFQKLSGLQPRLQLHLLQECVQQGNLVSGINSWAVGAIRYSAGILDWTMEDLVSMDRRTRKILAMNGCINTRSNLSRKAAG